MSCSHKWSYREANLIPWVCLEHPSWASRFVGSVVRVRICPPAALIPAGMPASTLRVLSPSLPAALQGAGPHGLAAEAARLPCAGVHVPWALRSGPAECAWGRRDAASGGAVAAAERGRAQGQGRGGRADAQRGRVGAALAEQPQTSTAAQPPPAVPLSNAERRGGGNTAELGLTDAYQGGLASTWEHRAWVAAGSGTLLAALAKGLTAGEAGRGASAERRSRSACRGGHAGALCKGKTCLQ